MNLKMIIVGDGGVGKTTFVTKHLTGNFEKKYVPTLGVEVRPYNDTFLNKYNIWDTAGREAYSGLKEGYYIEADVAIVMFAITSKMSFTHVPQWILLIRKINKNIPIVVCGNKIDQKYFIHDNNKVNQQAIVEMVKKYNVKYFDISAKSNYNYNKPFEYFDKTFEYVL
jgi:GTP-binding nuclear protein Ran